MRLCVDTCVRVLIFNHSDGDLCSVIFLSVKLVKYFFTQDPHLSMKEIVRV